MGFGFGVQISELGNCGLGELGAEVGVDVEPITGVTWELYNEDPDPTQTQNLVSGGWGLGGGVRAGVGNHLMLLKVTSADP